MVIGVVRTVILYLLIILGIRLMGKRQVGELEPSELVLDLIIADLAAVPMQDFGIPLLSGVLPILALLCVTMILSVLTMRSVRFRAVLCGRPIVIVRDGQEDQQEDPENTQPEGVTTSAGVNCTLMDLGENAIYTGDAAANVKAFLEMM